MATKKIKPVRLPAIYLWAAGQKALLEGRAEDSMNIQKLFTESTRYCQSEDYIRAEREKTIRGEIHSKKNKGLIPFERNENDLALATVVFGLGGEFKVYSERSYVPSGFLRFRKTDLVYIDKVSQIIREDSRSPELLNNSDKKLVINFLDGLSTQKVFYKTVNDGSNVLKISGEFEIFSSLPKSFECLISLWNEPEKDIEGNLLNSGTFSRRLGKGSLSTNDTQELLLTLASAQTQLELAAASLVGQWLLLESPAIKVFGQLPDLTEDNEVKRIAIDPLPLLKKFTLGLSPIVYVDKKEAKQLADLHTWCVSDDTQTWLEALTK